MFDLASLNPAQRLAVETIQGPVLVLAGAGTGKTRVITHRIAHLIRRGIPPGQILAVTFTNKAAREMQERVRHTLGARGRAKSNPRGEEQPAISTFHSLCARILRQHIGRLGYKTSFVIYSEGDQLAVVKRILSQISTGAVRPDPIAVLAMLGRLRDGSFQTSNFTDSGSVELAAHIRARYESALRASNAVDFDDLILLTLRLLEEHAEVLDLCRTRYEYVMVDEYQDTSDAQFKLVHALTRKHRNLCVVGDDDQSIYGWRGAQIANLLDLEKHYPEVKVIKLEQNYRSTNAILTAANAVIKHNPRRRGKSLWSSKGPGGNLLLKVCTDEEEEARWIVEQIEFARQIKRIPWSAQAVLFRTNLQSRPIETALRQAGVRYHLIGGQSYFDRREVKDLLAYLKTLANPHDDASLLRIANVPARGLSDATLQALQAATAQTPASVFDAMRDSKVQAGLAPRVRESAAAFASWIERTRAPLVSGEPLKLQRWAEAFLAEIRYEDDLRRGEKDVEAADNRIRNLRDLVATLDSTGSPAADPMGALQDFLEELTLEPDRDEKKLEGDAVTLITVHSCKGLEFPHVFIAGLEDGLLPHSRSKTEGTLEEERRLFYVAITRAMETLTLTHCEARKKYGQLVPCHPSPFLKELPPDLVDLASQTGTQPLSLDSGKAMFASLREALQ